MVFGFGSLGLIWVLTPFQEVTHQPWREQRRETRARLVHQGAETVSKTNEQTFDDEQGREERLKIITRLVHQGAETVSNTDESRN